jgi:hypothetical protein
MRYAAGAFNDKAPLLFDGGLSAFAIAEAGHRASLQSPQDCRAALEHVFPHMATA